MTARLRLPSTERLALGRDGGTGLRLRRGFSRPAEGAPTAPGRLPRARTQAVTELFNAHYGRLVRTAQLLVDDRETAEDVVMDAFTSLYSRWAAIRDPDDAYRYLRSCVLNGARSKLRRRSVRRRHEGASLDRPDRAERPSQASTQPGVASSGTNRAAVVGLLRGLPPRQRQVLVMRYLLDMSELEVASELGISQGSVKSHASRGLAALARVLEVAE